MRSIDFLRQVHERLEPTTYLEIGVRHGRSLALSSVPSVGIDPSFDLRYDLSPQATLFRETSDEYFARPDPLAPLAGNPVALSFIDGMHLAEFALRDFINVERHAAWTSVGVFDDILPRDVDEAARDRHTYFWTGDVYKLLAILERLRPDLLCVRVGTEPTGLLLVLALDPDSRVLGQRYAALERELVTPDPQRVPRAVLNRRGVLDPTTVLDSSLWWHLREARASGVGRETGVAELRRIVRHELHRSRFGSLARLLPAR